MKVTITADIEADDGLTAAAIRYGLAAELEGFEFWPPAGEETGALTAVLCRVTVEETE